MLSVSGLCKSYGKQVLFEDVSFQVGPGERVGLVGRNGHGKTTLFRVLLGEESADEGKIAVPSGYRIGHLAQRLEFRHPTVLAEAASALPRREDGTDETYKAKAVLAGLGFDEADLSRPPAELSGGFQVRLNLARVLVSTPDLLLLDEPTNYLDIVSIRWLRRFLCAWKGALMLITHDRDFMDSVTTHTMAIHRCRVRKLPGNTEKLYGQILQEEMIHEQTRANDERKREEAEAFINRFRAQATKAKAVQSRIKAAGPPRAAIGSSRRSATSISGSTRRLRRQVDAGGAGPLLPDTIPDAPSSSGSPSPWRGGTGSPSSGRTERARRPCFAFSPGSFPPGPAA